MKTILFLFISVGVTVCEGNNAKRILLSDPDIINSRLGTLESQVHSLVQENKDQAQRIINLEKENQILKATSSSHGSTFIRWGRTVCPSASTELVYSGYAAGQRYLLNGKYTGGPTNTLCLPQNPDMSNTTLSSGWSLLYGTEYESDVFAHDSDDNDMPCAVCRNTNTTSSILIPGRRSCYSGWSKEYQGILASGYSEHRPSTYICIDANPEYLVSGEKDEDGHLFYPVKTHCGPLPCPPYHNDILVECVVCSK